eukprot:GILK01002533.1.p1 GENE.GILK01002533.1~~GILK01002533.1.p1  ORF type:complete len:174 (+),score=17.37 GILK01002533.1:116-637(+)
MKMASRCLSLLFIVILSLSVTAADDTNVFTQSSSLLSSSKCYNGQVTYNGFWPLNLAFKLTKTSSAGSLQMFVSKGSTCPDASTHDYASDTVSDENQSTKIVVTRDSSPSALSDGSTWSVSVVAPFGLGNLAAGSVTYNLEAYTTLSAGYRYQHSWSLLAVCCGLATLLILRQ